MKGILITLMLLSFVSTGYSYGEYRMKFLNRWSAEDHLKYKKDPNRRARFMESWKQWRGNLC